MTRVLHVLDHSLPEQSGYAYRSHAILQELQRKGVELEAITSPKQGPCAAGEDNIDGVRYLRSDGDHEEGAGGVAGQLRTIRATRARIEARVSVGKFDVIHAHSPCLNGLASLRQRAPVIYEMRSSWEDAAVSVGTTRQGSARYRLSRVLETFTLRRADRIVVICDGLRSELVERGIPGDRITIVPNALAPEMLARPPDETVELARQRFGVPGSRMIGFFGSFFEWEGVDQLVRALPALGKRIGPVHLLLAGGGRQDQLLRRMATEMNLHERITFAGRVDHDTVRALYGIVDAMIFPRVRSRLTDMVTPIKPLEAMAQGAVVIASDVGGHRELVRHAETGFLYAADSQQSLVDSVAEVLGNIDAMDAVRSRARAYIDAERRWSQVAARYLPLYESLGRGNNIGRG